MGRMRGYNADVQYLTLVKEILEEGYYDQNRTGMPTKKIFGWDFEFDLQKEFPILTTKKVAFKTAVEEMLWIMNGNNDVNDLEKKGVKIWREWMQDDGTIGRAYGYQIAKYDQVNKLIHTLRTNPQDRAMIISLWNIEDLPYMALRPCAFMTMWDVTDGYLNCTLVQRSGDVGLGIPFNMTQYAVFIHMIAQVTGLKVGKFKHYINNAHIYENHFAPLTEQLSREPLTPPKFWINPEIKEFKDFTVNDVKLIDYRSHDSISMEVSV